MRFTLRQLRCFVEIVEAGSMNRAAERLRLAPTALSLQVRGMEDRLGVALLDRHARGVAPTSAGRELYRRGRDLLALAKDAERDVILAGRGAARMLRLGVPHTAARLVGAEVIDWARGALDGVELELREGYSSDLVALLDAGELDFVLGFQLEPSSQRETIEVMEEELLFVTAAEAGGPDGPVRLADVLASDLIFLAEKDSCWRLLAAAAAALGLASPAGRRIESMNVIRQMVKRGAGSAIASSGAFRDENRRGEVRMRFVEDAPIVRRLSLAWSRARRLSLEDERLVGMLLDLVELLQCRLGRASRVLARVDVG